MTLRPILAAALALVATGSLHAQDLGTGQEVRPGLLAAGGLLDDPDPDLVFSIGAGAAIGPTYPGSGETEWGPAFRFRFDFIRFPNGFEIGSGRAVGFRTGWGIQGSARYIGERTAEDSPELAGLEDLDRSFEFGFGVGYEQRNYRFFADARYGFIGHNSWVGQLGADLIAYPVDGLTITFGPRVDLGSTSFVSQYYGITAAEAAASSFAQYTPEGGIVSAGLNLEARYQFNPLWGVEARASWDRLMGDAADSPIVLAGDDDQVKFSIALTRRISVNPY